MREIRTGAAPGPRARPSVRTTPRPQQPRFDTLEFELREDDYAVGTTLVANFFGLGGSYWKVRVIGRIHQASGDWAEVDFGHFLKMSSKPLELLEGYDRKNGVEHLQKCRTALLKDGWQEINRGQWWYSWRFQRRTS